MFFKDVARIQINGEVLGLDVSGDITYISHAHSDHINGKKNGKVLASKQTIDIAGLNTSEVVPLRNVQLYNAGHMLGATQIQVVGDDGVFVYTGDICTEEGFTFNGAEIPECDTLLIEATYGSSEFQFPKKEDIAQQIRREVLSRLYYGNVIFAVYAKGKAQELNKILNEYCDITPIVTEEIAKVNEVYSKYGQRLRYVSSSSPDAQDMFKGNFVGIIPKSMFRPELRVMLSNHYKKMCFFGSLSGWNIKFPNDYYDIALPFSDHSDFNGLLEYVEYSNPKKVYVFGPYAENFSKVLKSRGYSAYPVR
ncbi:MAG: hypothetical protein ACP5H8_03480 [Candidatus Micrarchaeia archaeon]